MNRTPSFHDPAAKQHSRRLLVSLQACLCELLAEDDVVYHGQLGHLFLPGVAHVLRVRLIAPRAKRLEMAMQRERLTEYEASRKIDQVDAERARWTRFFYGVDITDPNLYDLVVNLEAMTPEDAADTVAYTALLPSFRASDTSRKRLKDLCLSSRVRAQLLSDPSTAQVELEVDADGGRVRLGGLLTDQHLERVRQVVAGLPGVQHLDTPAALKTK